ncbi:MAG: ester cyclase [Vicinamibacterales bacterium]
MTREAIEQRLAEHQAGFLARNPDMLAATHTADGTFESPAHGLVSGRAAIRDVYGYWYKAFPDFKLSWGSALIDPPRAAVFWKFEGTTTGPFFGEVRPGTPIRMAGAAEYTFGDEGIVAVRHIFDFSAILVSAGVMKIKPA